jgi:hypothetical protein
MRSEEDVRLAISTFFSSDTRRARSLIDSLRKDGMTDEYLARLKAGCGGCYVHLGRDRTGEDPKAWYAVAGIAPSFTKRTVVFLVECEHSVWIDHRLFGG